RLEVLQLALIVLSRDSNASLIGNFLKQTWPGPPDLAVHMSILSHVIRCDQAFIEAGMCCDIGDVVLAAMQQLRGRQHAFITELCAENSMVSIINQQLVEDISTGAADIKG